jgi:hypothetical protein
MPTMLQDPAALKREPSSRHAFPEIRSDVDLRAPRTLAEELLASYNEGTLDTETSFELASPGGYARNVTGKVVYLDDEAHTFMVREADELTRVPLRDVTSAHTAAATDVLDPR